MDSFAEEILKPKTVFHLTSTHHFYADPEITRSSKTSFMRWGKLSKDKPSDPFSKAGRQFEGLPRVKNHQVEIHKNVVKLE